jgi:uncharacterized tellurite resistance protein B-like protein
MSILEWLGLRRPDAGSDPSAETQTVRRIVERLDHMEPERARFVAAFAYVLSRVARADLHVSEEETRAMERIVMRRGSLPEEQAVIVVQMAKSQNVLFGGTENYLVTRELNRIATREQKLALVECLYAVSAADDSITTLEDNVIRQIGAELRLEHREIVEVRSRFREHRAVLRKPGEEGG